MAAGNRKSSNKRKTQTKKERMAEMEKAQAFRVEVTLWIVVAAALLLFIQRNDFDVRIMLRTLRARNQHLIPRKSCFYPRRRHKTACITASGFILIVMLK